jgi:hypothetical protein
MVFPLAKRDEAKIAKVVGHEEIQEEIAEKLPIVGLVENLEGINKPPSIWMEL